eukprot:CAMPEP_0168755210 /NCGR_PEP_ID=MMETSP0724-20121128/19937_1 /TAXON_ID=265536 /ORGANISM="Amphiprora sp., Strain CCMP467" /LENGTH=37 /DNA_ID= /DNA_START= /DNA_END= /DNA_ORIENTATION=
MHAGDMAQGRDTLHGSNLNDRRAMGKGACDPGLEQVL